MIKVNDDDLNEYDNNDDDDDDDDELAVLFFLFFLRSLLKQLPCLTSPWSIHLKPFLWLQGFCVQKKKKRKWYTLFYTMTTTTQHHQQNNNCRREIFCVTLKHKTIWVKTPFSYLNVKKKKERKKRYWIFWSKSNVLKNTVLHRVLPVVERVQCFPL